MRDGWKEISLEDLETSGVIKLGRGDVISKKDMEADPGPNPVYSSAENKNGMIGKYAKYMFHEELITWSVDGGGHIFYRPKHKFSVTNIGGWLRILDSQVFLYQFLTYALQSLHKQHHFDWQHKAHPSVIRKLYTRIPIAPLSEQKRIVDLISSVDSYIEALQQHQNLTKQMLEALSQKTFLGQGGSVQLHMVATCIMGQSPEGSTCNKEGIGTPLLTGPTEFQKNNWVGPPRQWTTNETKISISQDILFCVRGATAGRMNLTNYRSVIGRGLAAIRCENPLDTHFVRFALQCGLNQLLPAAGGTIFPNISQSQLRSFKLPWPIETERRFLANLLKSVEDNAETLSQNIAATKNLRSSLLDDLLSGEHEIPASYDKVMGAA